MTPPGRTKERRKSPRRGVDGVSGSFLLSADARVLNMSVDGIALEASSPLKVGREYSLKLADSGEAIPLIGKVVWCSLVRTQRGDDGDVQPVYRAGMHFEKILEGAAGELQQFISKHAMVSLEKRLFGRFRLQEERSASVEYEAEFRVLQLSTCGMLVETEAAPPVDSTHRMEVRFPEIRFDAEARIARSERVDSDSGPLHRLGIELLQLDPKTEKLLEQFILAESE